MKVYFFVGRNEELADFNGYLLNSEWYALILNRIMVCLHECKTNSN